MEYIFQDKESLHPDNNSLENIIYRKIKEEIRTLVIKPGEKMSEMKIAKKMDCSRSPVRGAFRQLQHQGFLEIRPQIGTFVPFIDLVSAEKTRFIRESLETSVLKLGIKTSAYDNQIEYLQDLINRQNELYKNKRYVEFEHLDQLFHSFFCNTVNKPFIKEYLGSADVHYSRLQSISLRYDPYPIVTIEQHQEILNSVKAKNISQMEKAVSTHLQNLYRVVRLCKNNVQPLIANIELLDSLIESL
ncbi:GntR family transcriptional regulator [Clostridium sp. KNHs216]|uniref:GntR family transcriptional regulator n=1 Tax=Clostridium sp. KNHs216 TaxID=1550235 RepID=UPI00115419FB|nr:GntR family transcriptional regulator [Clostridium sp. KNHs216]TQI68321.1 DNA-binding GntR family transcriptional regulator [Clostridium sp. KNHs216]